MTRVYTISNVVTVSYPDGSQANEINAGDTARREIESENESQELASKIRLEVFQEMLYRSLVM